MVSLHGGGLGGDVALDALDISRDGDARRLGGGGETAQKKEKYDLFTVLGCAMYKP